MRDWIEAGRDRLRTAHRTGETEQAVRDTLGVAEAVALRLAQCPEVADPVACLSAADAAANARDGLSALTGTHLALRAPAPRDADDPAALAGALGALASDILTALDRADATAADAEAALARSSAVLAAHQLLNCGRGDP